MSHSSLSMLRSQTSAKRTATRYRYYFPLSPLRVRVRYGSCPLQDLADEQFVADFFRDGVRRYLSIGTIAKQKMEMLFLLECFAKHDTNKPFFIHWYVVYTGRVSARVERDYQGRNQEETLIFLPKISLYQDAREAADDRVCAHLVKGRTKKQKLQELQLCNTFLLQSFFLALLSALRNKRGCADVFLFLHFFSLFLVGMIEVGALKQLWVLWWHLLFFLPQYPGCMPIGKSQMS